MRKLSLFWIVDINIPILINIISQLPQSLVHLEMKFRGTEEENLVWSEIDNIMVLYCSHLNLSNLKIFDNNFTSWSIKQYNDRLSKWMSFQSTNQATTQFTNL